LMKTLEQRTTDFAIGTGNEDDGLGHRGAR
jgi:hypothetical protein